MFIIRVDGRVTYNGWAHRDPRITRARSLASLSRGIARDDQFPHPHHSRPGLSMFEQSTVSSPFSSSTIAHSTLSPLALTQRVPPPGSSQQYTGSPFASVSFHPMRHGSISNTTSSTISLDEFFALSRDARATNARRAIVRRGFRPVVIRRATVARVALVVVVIIANVRNARISPSRAKDSRPRSSVFVCRRAISMRRESYANRLVVSSRDSPMTPSLGPWIKSRRTHPHSGTRGPARARRSRRSRPSRRRPHRRRCERTIVQSSRVESSRVESSRVERVSLDWKRPRRVRIARSGWAGRVGDGGDDGAGGRARESRGDARGETTRGGGRVEAREGGEDAGEFAGRVGG